MSDTDSSFPPCSKCQSNYVYEDGQLFICPECDHEWSANDVAEALEAQTIKDANGTVLKDGDTVSVIKDLRVKGSSLVVKIGTKVKGIRLVGTDGVGGHDIDCKIPGVGPMALKSEFVKKV